MEPHIELTDLDRSIWEEELADFIPEKVFDAHTHVYDLRAELARPVELRPNYEKTWKMFPLSTWEYMCEVDSLLFPGRTIHRISFGNPLQDCPSEKANAFTASEVAKDPESVALMLVRPDMTPEEVIRQVEIYGFRGLKPYRAHSVTGDTVECRIADYLPEPQISVADKLGLMIVLHLSKSQAIADEENLSDLERYTEIYPNVKWILAHCARCYYDRPLLKAGDRLRRMENLWYDISSVCDSDIMAVLLNIAGPNRVMYGSDDIPIGILRGKYITFGHSWCSLNEENHSFNLDHCDGRMTFTRYESLRAFRRAVRRVGYGREEIQRLFYKNASELVAMGSIQRT